MKTVNELMTMANDPNVHVKRLEKEAKELLGDNCPSSKPDILAALQAYASSDAAKTDTNLIEVLIARKYAPMGVYEAEEDGEWYEYTQTEGDQPRLTIASGRTARLPKQEALRAVKAHIAEITANSFG